MKHNRCVCKKKANSSDDSSNRQRRVSRDTKVLRWASGTVVIFSPWHLHIQRLLLRFGTLGPLAFTPALLLPCPFILLDQHRAPRSGARLGCTPRGTSPGKRHYYVVGIAGPRLLA